MKFSLFSDLHHYPGVFRGGTVEHLRFIQSRAENAGCDFIIHAGDFCHGPAEVADYVKLYNNFHIPSYHCLGNHDTDRTPLADTLRYYNMPAGHYFFDCKGYRIIVCDPNYYFHDGEYIHYDMGNYYAHGAERDYMPPEQLAWLSETIAAAPGPCVLISHESFEREADGVKNLSAVRDIINAANRRKKNSVLLVINGHYHRDNLRILDGVCYFEINSTSYDWVPNAHTCYPEDLCRETTLLNHTVCYNDPVHAIVTLEGNTIRIEGMESTMFLGINRRETGNNDICDAMGRPVVPRVQSAEITLG
ncbi:MAG: metallophosphoesterase [Clostridia bacterium]|nr:metallophosphoesterase [Clostridia bacterium]